MSLPHTYNPVFTASTTSPPASGADQVTIPYGGFAVSSTSNATEGTITFFNNGTIDFSGLSFDELYPWGSSGSLTTLDTAGWWESKNGTLTASDYDIKFQWFPGSFQNVIPNGAPAQNTWYSLGSTRGVTFYHSEATSFQRINTGNLLVAIRLNSTGNVLCDKTLSILTRINEP